MKLKKEREKDYEFHDTPLLHTIPRMKSEMQK